MRGTSLMSNHTSVTGVCRSRAAWCIAVFRDIQEEDLSVQSGASISSSSASHQWFCVKSVWADVQDSQSLSEQECRCLGGIMSKRGRKSVRAVINLLQHFVSLCKCQACSCSSRVPCLHSEIFTPSENSFLTELVSTPSPRCQKTLLIIAVPSTPSHPATCAP